MNKKYFSAIVVLITIILVVFMIFNKDEDNSYIMVKDENKDFVMENNKDFEKEVNENIDEFILSIEKIEDKNNKIEEDESIETEELDNKYNKLERNENFNFNYNETKLEEGNKEEKEEIFIVDKNKILTSLSVKEKFTLMKMTKELSRDDYTLIIESIKNDGEEECALEIVRILQKGLDEEDYNSVKRILETYINIDLLEEKTL